MPQKPDDRPKAGADQAAMDEPQIFLIIDGKKFPRPSLETFFARASGSAPPGCSCHPVALEYCKCHKIAVPAPCNHVGRKSGGTVVGCRCAPVQ